LNTALVGDVVGGFADALGPPVGALAKTAVNTATAPDELQNKLLDLALDHVVTPFLDAGSEKLGDAFGDALVQGTGLKPKSPPPTPSTKAVTQVQSRLQITLTNELAAMPDIRAAAKKAGLSPRQLAAELAAEIAEGLARALADGLVQLSPSSHLNDSSIASVAKQFATKQLSPQPPATGAYTVKPGDSLWNISQRLLGPGATARQIEQTSHLIYHDNQTTIGANPNHLVPGQVLHIPSTRESALSQGWVLLPWLVVAPGTLAGIAIRRRRRSKRRPAVQAEVKASITYSRLLIMTPRSHEPSHPLDNQRLQQRVDNNRT
jgi:nucleoid-associated protein YgaU